MIKGQASGFRVGVVGLGLGLGGALWPMPKSKIHIMTSAVHKPNEVHVPLCRYRSASEAIGS